MKRLVLLFAILLAFGGAVSAIPNPAAVYCSELGYEYKDGDCIFPDGSRCDAWQYYCKCQPNGIGCWAGDFNCDFPCEELACKETGEFVTISRCCEGLREIARKEAYTDECRLVGWIGWVYICSDCGNGICESWESICNCPEDCARVHNITQGRYYERIQNAIDDANDGDEIVVADGIYTGDGNRDINFLGKAVTVRSESGPENCIIDCNSTETESHRGFVFRSGEDSNSVLEGFTITNGFGPGGGILCLNSSPVISNCNISGNRSEYDSGGISFENSSAIITNCTISNNSAREGGGISCFQSSVVITNCTINDNSVEDVGGGIFCYGSSPTITNCTITNNIATSWDGGGILCYDSSPIINNCTISGNSGWRGGGIYCSRQSRPTITNCTFVGNSASNGNALAFDSWRQRYPSDFQMTNSILWNGGNEIWNNDGSTITITYSDIQGGWPGIGNIDADPCFVEPGYWDANNFWVEGDYYLLPDSLCIDAGDPNYVAEPNETDIDGNPRIINGRIDMGAYETNYIQAAMKLTPQMLNCNSKGKYIKAHLTLPEGFLPEDVDVNEPAVAEPMGIDFEYINVLGSDNGPVRLEIAFDRGALCNLLTNEGSVMADDGSLEITVAGSLTTGQYFYGSDTIKIKPRR